MLLRCLLLFDSVFHIAVSLFINVRGDVTVCMDIDSHLVLKFLPKRKLSMCTVCTLCK
jgi:hypothetical protein